jgi:hypothetical protein
MRATYVTSDFIKEYNKENQKSIVSYFDQCHNNDKLANLEPWFINYRSGTEVPIRMIQFEKDLFSIPVFIMTHSKRQLYDCGDFVLFQVYVFKDSGMLNSIWLNRETQTSNEDHDYLVGLPKFIDEERVITQESIDLVLQYVLIKMGCEFLIELIPSIVNDPSVLEAIEEVYTIPKPQEFKTKIPRSKSTSKSTQKASKDYIHIRGIESQYVFRVIKQKNEEGEERALLIAGKRYIGDESFSITITNTPIGTTCERLYDVDPRQLATPVKIYEWIKLVTKIEDVIALISIEYSSGDSHIFVRFDAGVFEDNVKLLESELQLNKEIAEEILREVGIRLNEEFKSERPCHILPFSGGMTPVACHVEGEGCAIDVAVEYVPFGEAEYQKIWHIQINGVTFILTNKLRRDVIAEHAGNDATLYATIEEIMDGMREW